MTIEETEQKFLSHSNACPCCGADKKITAQWYDHQLDQEKETYAYTCGFKVVIDKEANKTISVELKSHCSYTGEVLKRIIKSYE